MADEAHSTETLHGWLTYEAGNEHGPSRYGRSVLMIGPDGATRLDNFYAGDRLRTWTGNVSTNVLAMIAKGLSVAGYPEAPKALSRIPDSVDRCLRLTTSAEESRLARNWDVAIPWSDAMELPGYAEVFAVLDDVVAELSGMAIALGPGTLPPSLTGAKLTFNGPAGDRE